MKINDAIKEWEGRDIAALVSATKPPIDEIGDEVYDVFLAVVFRDAVGSPTVTGRLARIEAAIDANLPMIARLRECGGADQAARIEAMVRVLRRWKIDILEAAIEPEDLTERCPTCGEPVKTIFDHVDRDESCGEAG